jgi:uncharacterized protein involved in exopolysaccharide biosynthesis
LIIAAFLMLAGTAPAQSKGHNEARASAAFAEVLFRKTELLAESESFAESYTFDNPKMADLRYEVAALEKYLNRLTGTPLADVPGLTLALGKLMVRRAALDTEVSRLSRTMNGEHPEYKRAKRRLEVYDAAIKEILP